MRKNKTDTRTVRILLWSKVSIFFPFLSYNLNSFDSKNVYTAKFDGRQSKLSSKGGIPYV